MAVRKLIVGILSLVCLATAAGLWIFDDDPLRNPVASVTTRLGIMLGALWLALPRQGENPAWEKCLPAVVAVIVVLSFIRGGSWRVLLYAIPAAIVVGIAAVFLRPRSKRRPPPR